MKYSPNAPFFFFMLLLIVAMMRVSIARAGEIPQQACPPAVLATLRQEMQSGHLDSIKHLSIEGRSLYIAEVDLPGDRDLRIHMDSQGRLLKTREEIPLEAAPQPVRDAVTRLMPPNGHLDDVFREKVQGKTTYRIEIDRTQERDLNFHLAEDGSQITRSQTP